MTKKITLYQAMKQSGLFTSKKEIIAAANAERVTIDEVVTPALQFQFSPTKRKFCIDGKEISLQQKKYFVLNKPVGYSCQKNETEPYVVTLLHAAETVKNSLFPVGRLDFGTTGLLIITNDGDFSAALMEPQRKVSKTYRVSLKQKVTAYQINALEKGVFIVVDDEKCQTLPATVRKIDDHTIEVVIVEGKNRQVRKMVEAVGNAAAALCRVAIGNFVLDKELEEGRWKEYGEKELRERIFETETEDNTLE